MLVKFTRIGPGDHKEAIWIHPDYVGYLTEARVPGQVYVQMKPIEQYAFVEGTLDEVAEKLNGGPA